jgi:RIO kinase 1
MPNEPYLDASVAWRIKSGNIGFQEADYRTTVNTIISAGLATEVLRMISAGKEADVYLCRYRSAPIAVKAYRLYRTSHRGGRPIKLDSTGYLAAQEWDLLLQAWRGGASVPTPAKRVENMLSMRYIGEGEAPAPRLQDVSLEDPYEMARLIKEGMIALLRSGVVHSDLSPFNILVHQGRPWFIDLSEGIRIDRVGYSAWMRREQVEKALSIGLNNLRSYFKAYGTEFEHDGQMMSALDAYFASDGRVPLKK